MRNWLRNWFINFDLDVVHVVLHDAPDLRAALLVSNDGVVVVEEDLVPALDELPDRAHRHVDVHLGHAQRDRCAIRPSLDPELTAIVEFLTIGCFGICTSLGSSTGEDLMSRKVLIHLGGVDAGPTVEEKVDILASRLDLDRPSTLSVLRECSQSWVSTQKKISRSTPSRPVRTNGCALDSW